MKQSFFLGPGEMRMNTRTEAGVLAGGVGVHAGGVHAGGIGAGNAEDVPDIGGEPLL